MARPPPLSFWLPAAGATSKGQARRLADPHSFQTLVRSRPAGERETAGKDRQRTLYRLCRASYPATAARRLLDDKSIDAVFVCTPHHWHCPIALAALQAGKHVYLEKPASHVYREGQLLLQAAEKYRRVLQHGTQMRSSAVTARAREVLR